MQQLSKSNPSRCRMIDYIFVIIALIALSGSKAWAAKAVPLSGEVDYRAPLILLAAAAPPDFLNEGSSPPPEEKGTEGTEDVAITPFIGPDQALTTQPTPERPAISANEGISLDRPEVTAGVNVDLGTFKFNLGYTLPASQVDSLARPLGVNLEPGTDSKRFSLGVKIPF